MKACFAVKEVTVVPNKWNYVEIQIDMDLIDVIEAFGADELLEVIGRTKVKEYFDLAETEEEKA
jgi:hypothetical protein